MSDPIRFGTNGWRGVLGEEVTPSRMDAVVRGAAGWIASQWPGGDVAIGFDRRRGSDVFARRAAVLVAEAGLAPLLSDRPLPTPAITHRVVADRLAAGLVLTASHNPAVYAGLKVFGSSGGPIDDEAAHDVERRAERAVLDALPAAPPRYAVESRDLVTPYVAALRTAIDVERIAKAAPRVFYDALHGVGAGVLDHVLREAGARVRVCNASHDPDFGGQPPDPTPERLADLARRLDPGEIGLATDGDADRFAVVDEAGEPLTPTQSLALLVDHLGRTGRLSRGVAITTATGTLVEKVASRWQVEIERVPSGFKHLSQSLVAGRMDAAGDESGGFALAPFGHDKDGVLAACLTVEIQATGKHGVRGALQALEGEFGSSACGATRVPASATRCDALAKLSANPPGRFDGARVEACCREDGLRLDLADGFVMLRRSGTEPVIRIFAEAVSAAALEERLACGRALLEAA